MPNPLKVACQKLKHFARLLVTGVLFAIVGVDSTFLARLVTDLTLKGLSLNQTREHLHLLYNIDLTKHELQHIRYEAARKAKEVNHKLDRDVATKVKTMEIDEEFQGNENVILGAADKKSAYVLGIKHAPDRTEASLTAFLRPIARTCANIQVVITDLFRPYAAVVKSLFARARHLLCHVHACRAVMRRLSRLEAKARRLQRQAEEDAKTLDRLKGQIKGADAKQKELAKKVRDLEGEMEALEEKKRAAREGRTKIVDNQLESKNARLVRYRASAKELEKRLARMRKRRDKLAGQVRKVPRELKRSQQDALQSGRLAKKFYDLLDDRSPSFEAHKARFFEVLGRSRWTLAPYLAKFTNEHPELFSLRKARDLAPNHQNTNRIEGIFGLFRPLLNSTRLLQTPAGINAYGELFRLYHNVTPPFTGPHNDTAPAERLGAKLHGKTYLDFLFPARGRVTRFVLGSSRTDSTGTLRARGLPGLGCEILAC